MTGHARWTALVLTASAAVAAQAPRAVPRPALLSDIASPITLQAGIGHSSERIPAAPRDAQAFYDQGLSYLHSFVWLDAARSFNAALRLAPDSALAYVGLSVAILELNDATAARDALDRARAIAAHESEYDRMRVDLRGAQVSAEAAPADARLLRAYRAALDAAVARYPQDAELWLLRGMAESTDPAERGQGSPASSIRFYTQALSLAPNDDAPHHLLAHAYENSGQEDRARAEAAVYASMAPAIAHAHHMVGHAAERTGRMQDAIAAFEAADKLERAHLAEDGVIPEHAWHFEHNLDLLGAAYAYTGRVHDAERTLKAAFDLPTELVEEGFNKRNWPEFLIARGRFAEAASAGDALTRYPSPLVTATGRIERARALMAERQFEAAAAEANDALRDMRRATDGAAMVAPILAATQAEFLLRTSDPARGRERLESFVRTVRASPGPDTWIDGLFAIEHIAAAARDAGQWDVAAWAAGEMRAYDPQYGGTHLAAAFAAEHSGDAAHARSEFAAAARAWSAADPDFDGLATARREER